MSYVVVEHHFDPIGGGAQLPTEEAPEPEVQGAYRVVIGIPVTGLQTVVDEEGLAVSRCSECERPVALGEGIEPAKGHARGCSRTGEPGDEIAVEEVVVRYEGVREYLFAEDDERWSGLSPEDRAKVHREAIKEAISEQATERRAAPKTKDLPGIGTEL